MYRFLERLTPEDVEAVAALVFLEMQEAGFAAVGEFHYLHHRPGGEPYAALAAELPTDTATSFDVALRKDAKFHDGSPVTADDVVFSF